MENIRAAVLCTGNALGAACSMHECSMLPIMIHRFEKEAVNDTHYSNGICVDANYICVGLFSRQMIELDLFEW
jgi:hypothetical protein